MMTRFQRHAIEWYREALKLVGSRDQNEGARQNAAFCRLVRGRHWQSISPGATLSRGIVNRSGTAFDLASKPSVTPTVAFPAP